MRRVTAWIGGIASGVVAYRFWRRHHAPDAAPEPEVEPDSPEDRRRRVHEEGRAALDEMQSDGAGN